jgi:hypothetical protein
MPPFQWIKEVVSFRNDVGCEGDLASFRGIPESEPEGRERTENLARLGGGRYSVETEFVCARWIKEVVSLRNDVSWEGDFKRIGVM